MPGLSNPSVRIRYVTQSHSYTVHIEFYRTDHFRNSFIPLKSRLWNFLDSSVFPPSYDTKTSLGISTLGCRFFINEMTVSAIQ